MTTLRDCDAWGGGLMGRGSILVLTVAGVAVCGALATAPGLAFATVSATARPADAARPVASAAAPVWGNAQELPGIAALDDGGVAFGAKLSCPSPGNCAVGGSYLGATVGSGSSAYVADQRNGAWGKAIEVPGIAALNVGGDAGINSLWCSSAGDCTAGGNYSPGGTDASGIVPALDAFVVTERNGTWGKAIEVPGTGARNAGHSAGVSSVSCWSPGDCTAVGWYAPGGVVSEGVVDSQVFVVTERDGAWGGATELPGLAALNTGKLAVANAISCTAGGNCAVGGFYSASGRQQAFVADESDGTWQPAKEVPGNGEADVSDVSCASPGNCGAVGEDSDGRSFVASEVNGTWRTADALPDDVSAGAISCPSAGNCLTGGSQYTGVTDNHPNYQAFVMTERNGTWGKPQPVPGLAGLNIGQTAAIQSVSCSAAGDCAADGYYADTIQDRGPPPPYQALAFVVAETDGTWGRAQDVPGNPSEPPTTADVSCASRQGCTAAVSYGGGGVVVVSTKAPTATAESLSASTVTYGREQAEQVSVAVTAKAGGPPAGKVAVSAGSTALCVITLRSGLGSCTLSAYRLAPGTYRVTAAYPGSPDFAPSVSGATNLTVVK